MKTANASALPTLPPPFFHWDLRQFRDCRVPYLVNVAGAPGLGYEATAVEVRKAFAEWQKVEPAVIQFVNPGPTFTAWIANDAQNVLFWDTDFCGTDVWDATLRSGGIAVTCLNGSIPLPGTSTGVIEDADIVFNATPYTWTNIQQVLGGDDDYGFIGTIHTGANGICETRAVCGDLQLVPYGGLAGANQTCVARGGPTLISRRNAGGSPDVWSIAAHEIGHFCGLGENNDVGVGPGVTETIMIEPFDAPVGGTLIVRINNAAPITITLTGGANLAAVDVANDIAPKLSWDSPTSRAAYRTDGGGVEIRAPDPAQDVIIVTGGTAAGALGFVVGESGLATMAQGNRRNLISNDMRTLASPDWEGLNFLYSPDLGDALEVLPGKHQSYVHTETPRDVPPLLQSGVPLYKPGPGPVHLFGSRGLQFEWLGPEIDDHRRECEALVVNRDDWDDGVQIPIPMIAGQPNRVVVTVRTWNPPRFANVAAQLLYLNGYFDFDGDFLFTPGDRYIHWRGFSGFDGPDAINQVGPQVSLGDGDFQLNFDIVPPPGSVGGYARFRLDYGENEGRAPAVAIDPSLGPAVGVAQFGEVEDYVYSIGLPDLPDVIQVQPLQLVNDCFPSNDQVSPTDAAAFDTTAALIKTAYNSAELTWGTDRPDVPGDTVVVRTAPPYDRLDFVFRILPGVGNYVTLGYRPSGVARRPDQVPRVLATSGDGSFWGEFLADNGAFGTGGNGATGPGHVAGAWNPNLWNSARMDSAERNLFPAEAFGNLPQLESGVWASMYHESDPKCATLGILKNRCFLADTTSGQTVDSDNITCGEAPYPPPWTADGMSGFNPNEVPGFPGKTREFTKIIPDGQLTPGAHVQYFIRASYSGAPGEFELAPDTTRVYPQHATGSSDGERWLHFGVLPDRWKDPFYGPGSGMACMLVVNLDDAHGSERAWAGIADSIGATLPNKFGAHNGWHAPGGGADINDPSGFRASHGGQPGTHWDLYTVRGGDWLETGSAAALGSRGAQAPIGLAVGKQSRQGPTPEMLRKLYRTIVILGGDRRSDLLGPFENRSQADAPALLDFLQHPVGTPLPRGIWISGTGFVQSEDAIDPGRLLPQLGIGFRAPSYADLSSNPESMIDLLPASAIEPLGTGYSLPNASESSPNVLDVLSGDVPEATAAAFYENVGWNGPYVAGVLKPNDWGSGRHWVSLVDGWNLSALRNQFGGGTTARIEYAHHVLTNVFWEQLCFSLPPPVSVGEPPMGSRPPFREFFALRSAHPLRGREAVLAFGTKRTGRVTVDIFDISGRLVRRVADAVFEGGSEHLVSWDGINATGGRVAAGVFICRLRAPSFQAEKKLVLLRGR